ncbi:Type I restriction enzyme M protein, partial [Clarias magur]
MNAFSNGCDVQRLHDVSPSRTWGSNQEEVTGDKLLCVCVCVCVSQLNLVQSCF